MAELGDGHSKEFWLDYLQTVQSSPDQRASTYTVHSWCQEIGNFHSVESPSQVRAGIISCWNLWFRDLYKDFPELFRTLCKAKFFSRSITFLQKLHSISKITHRKIYQLNQQYFFSKTFDHFDSIIQIAICILSNTFANRRQERTWIQRTLDSSRHIKYSVTRIISKIDPEASILSRRTATTE